MSERNLRQDKNFLDLISELEQADGYFLGVNVIKGNVITHRMVTENFPKLELLPSLLKVKEKCVEELERSDKVIRFPNNLVQVAENDNIAKDTE